MPKNCDIHSHQSPNFRCPSCGNVEWTEENSPFMINPVTLVEAIEQEDIIDIIEGVRNLDEIGPETLVRIHLYSFLREAPSFSMGITDIEMDWATTFADIVDGEYGNKVELILTSEYEITMTEVEDWIELASLVGVSLDISFLSEVVDCYTEIRNS